MSVADDDHLHSDYVATGGDSATGLAPTETPTANSSAHCGDGRGKIQPRRLWKQFAGNTLTAARMHAVEKGSGKHTDDSSAYENDGAFGEQDVSSHSPYFDATFKRMDTFASMGMEYLQMPEGGSLGAAVFGLIKGTVGPAILYLPKGFQNSGWAVAVPSMIVATAMYVFNASRLLHCWQVEHERDLSSRPIGVAGHTLLTYPELARRAFGSLSLLVDIGIASLQFGVCLTYLIFVPHNLVECTEALFGVEIDKVYFLLFMLLVEIPLGWIRDITKLTPTNVLATGLIVYGLFFVIVLAFIQGMAISEDGKTRVFAENLRNLPAFTDSWFLFIGTSFFMMEGSITLVVPLQESIVRAEDRAAFPRSNRTVTTGIVIFYIIFSIICCGAFGDEIHTALTASLEGPLATTIQLAYSVAVILTFPLQAFPAMEVVNINLLGQEGKGSSDMQRRILSTLVICILGVIAESAIDYLGNVVSILGSLFGIPLALVVPPLMHNVLIPDSPERTRLINYGIVIIGFFAMGAASFATIVTWDEENDP